MNLVKATRQAIERREALGIQDFDNFLDMMTGGPPSYTGKLVSPRNALSVSTCWKCINILADDLGSLPFFTYRWLDSGDPSKGKTQARDHYLWPLFTDEANPRMSAMLFQTVMETWRLLWGNAYAEIEMNGRGQITALWPWRPDRVKVWQENPNDIRSRVFYSYVFPDRSIKPLTLPSDNILHIRHTSLDGIVGLSPVEVHRNALGLAMAMQEHAGRFYLNGAVVQGLLTHPGKLGDKAMESLRESMKQYQGVSNAHRMMILEQGMDYKDIGMKLEDAQFIQSVNASELDIAGIYKVPAHRINQLERATNNNVEQLALEYIQYTLGPNAKKWLSEIHFSLLSGRERESIFVQPDFSYLLQGDHESLAKYYQALSSAMVLSPDEMREEIGRNPLPDGSGKYPRAPLNTIPINKADQPAEVVAPSNPPPNGNKKPNGVGALHQ